MLSTYTFCAEMQVKSSGSPKGQKVCDFQQILVVKLYSAPITPSGVTKARKALNISVWIKVAIQVG